MEGEEKNWVFPLKEPDFGELEKEGEGGERKRRREEEWHNRVFNT